MDERSPSMSVRRFVLLSMLALSVGTALAVAIAFARPAASEPRIVEVALADVPALEPLFVRPFNMGFSPSGAPYGIWLVSTEDGVLALFSAETYHPRRCAIVALDGDEHSIEGDWFIGGPPGAPCPSARYERDGSALYIAPRGMDRFDLEVASGLVRIDVSRLRLGDCSERVTFEGQCPYSRPDRPVYRHMSWPEG